MVEVLFSALGMGETPFSLSMNTSLSTQEYKRGMLPETFGGGAWPASQNPTLFITNICIIPHPIYDLTKN